MPSLITNSRQSLSDPRCSIGTIIPCTTTVTTITAILASANVLAFANYANTTSPVSPRSHNPFFNPPTPP